MDHVKFVPPSKGSHIPRATIQRMAVYVHVLETLMAEEGCEVISSERLAGACTVNPSQVRKDLAYFGEFGVRGLGYYVQDLIVSIKRALGVDRVWKTVLLGAGNLGRAILTHKQFRLRGFHIVAAFDVDPTKIGTKAAGLEVLDTAILGETTRVEGAEFGIITTPADKAQKAANMLVDAGIRGILNFAPARISVPPDVVVEYVDIFLHLYALAFNLSSRQPGGGTFRR